MYSNGEIWIGWLEAKSQNLRLVLILMSSSKGKTSGAICSPDQSNEYLQISNASIDDDQQLKFDVEPKEGKANAYGFQGRFDGKELTGQIERAGTKLPISFTKAEYLPRETSNLLAANSAWIGSLDVGTRKVPLRFRFYNAPPFASADKPRILMDSLAENANGFPATVSFTDKGAYEFSIPAIPGNAKYIATLSEDKKTLTGKFQQGFLPLQLDMQRVAEISSNPAAQDPFVQYLIGLGNKKPEPDKSSSQQKVTEEKAAVADAPKPQPLQEKSNKMPESKSTASDIGLSDIGIEEQPFTVERFDSSKPLLNETGKRADNSFQLAGTITFPKGFNPKLQHPAVVLVTGSGPQDRDETIGKHKPFREIANYLAAQGMVVLRYDDRGVGQSSGDFINATSADFADDALAVWQFAREIEGVDRTRVGIFGHSEGGIIGPMVASWQREVAFMILIAPPVLPGTEILSSQVDRIAELEGVDSEDRANAKALQDELQQIALRFPADDETALSEVRKAVVQRWDTLNRLSQSAPGADEAARKKVVIEAITAQFRGLQSRWMRHFLAYDPSSNWVLFDCPVLAVWAEKDTQVLFEPNRKKLQDIVTHNMNLKADLVVLPGLNHLLQKANTGLPDEYDQIDVAIEPMALELFGSWLKQREILP
jgi:pimeloyl-ACP methyl ester carboxylesterase